ncbi:MAG: hybrid sensor histidine kinase/response regulator [Alphaproteobacteria bacterium CG11_big_fil_rev_8_21_14_0_20_44_7]|nr:MAG: hybrid sensor histidine kinase/response regulator [Alphaproteobacteria bacterium CG11_big_fil_rev_8_21_14_0_20_44_7]
MDDLINEFITETNDSISELDTEIVQLEQNPEDYDLLNNIFRLMHTIKGTCGFLGLSRLEKVAHAGENVLDKMRNKELKVTSQAVTFILESIDKIKMILENLENTGSEPEGDDSELIKTLNDFAKDGGNATAIAADDDAEEEAALKAMEAEAEIAVEAEEANSSGDDIFPEDEFVPVPANMTGMDESEEPEAEAASEAEEDSDNKTGTSLTEIIDEKAKQLAIGAGLDEKSNAGEKKSASTASIRVGIDVLENLMQLVSELVLTRNQVVQIMRQSPELESDYAGALHRLSHITTDLQEGVMKTRMQPIGNAWNKLPRIIRDLSMELDKKIDLKMIGEETELDRQLLELIKDPLTHMVRNSADHGVETTAERKAAGKSETGTIILRAFHEGGHIIVEIKDDGKGIDPEIIKRKAIEKGLTTESEAAVMDKRQILQFIFAAGFSTAAAVTSVSGRGVGMDVVRTNVEKMGGAIDLDSNPGTGTTFQIKIPLTLAIMPVLIMEAGKQKFAIPQINILELVVTNGNNEHKIERVNDTPVLRLRGRLLPLIHMAHTLGLTSEDTLTEKQFIVVCELGNLSFGVIVDKIFDTEEIVVKPVSAALRAITLYSGSTILGDGSVIMILDPNGLARSINVNATNQANQDLAALEDENERTTSFLTFKAGGGAPKAIPLELVSRLEEIEVSQIEIAGKNEVVQYRGDLMYLINVESLEGEIKRIKESCKDKFQQVVVFTDRGRVLGLAVDEISDIIDENITSSLEEAKTGINLGSMVIAGKTTDVLDVHKVFHRVFNEFQRLGDKEIEQTKEKILLVEDSPFFRKLMVPILMSRGYRVKTASNGLEAARVLSKDRDFQLIITDLDMPEMNGFEFSEACKGDVNVRHIPIVALSSNASPETTARCEKIGMFAHVSKSEKERIFEVVSDALNSNTEASFKPQEATHE